MAKNKGSSSTLSKSSSSSSYYYDIMEDINRAPGAWCYLVVGGRNTGKTYSALTNCMDNDRKFVFVKRTKEDVQTLCARGAVNMELSPFKPINRDRGTNIQAFPVIAGVGAFYECDEDNNPVKMLGYLAALSMVQKIKGFDMSEADWMIFDEFIPQPWERISRMEGTQVLDLYKTIARDREHRGREPLKLIALANATKVQNPLFDILEVVDTAADLSLSRHRWTLTRGIFIHILQANEEFMEKESQSAIYQSMAGTDWARMALSNEFAYDDMSNVAQLSIKGMRPLWGIVYKKKEYVMYKGEGVKYMTDSYTNTKIPWYDLSKENDQKLFYIDRALDIRTECSEGKVKFKSYSLYDLVINYKNHFKL